MGDNSGKLELIPHAIAGNGDESGGSNVAASAAAEDLALAEEPALD